MTFSLSQSRQIQAVNGALKRVPAWPIYIVASGWAGWLFYLAATGQMGPEPINRLERSYGEVALQLLVAGLCITPLRRILGLNLLKYRRAIGLAAFLFVTAHLATWVFLDLRLQWGQIWTEIVKRPYITVGMAGFVALVPLAITSNNMSVRRLGAVGWRNLHKLTYLAAVLAAVHFLWLVKGWQLEPMLYLGAILVLLAMRLYFVWGANRSTRSQIPKPV